MKTLIELCRRAGWSGVGLSDMLFIYLSLVSGSDHSSMLACVVPYFNMIYRVVPVLKSYISNNNSDR